MESKVKYKNIKSEHQLRSLVFDDYFKNKDISWELEIEKIDFVITGKQSRKGKSGSNAGGGSDKHYLWAETKKSETDPYIMLTQLLLTIKKPYDKNEYIIPNYIGCFDTEKIIFIPTKLILNILHDNDIKWNITPSDIKDEYFLRIISKLKYVLFNNKEVKIFTFGIHDDEIKNFVKNNVLKGDIENKFAITDDNFDRIYLKWVDKVKPSIACNWAEEKKNGILDSDFYLADLLSRDDASIKDKLLIVLQTDHYKLIKAIKKSKLLIEDDDYFFKDKQKAYKAFWSIYERPPLPEFWDSIINRKDLLVPQDIRERKGSFFTPQIWVEKSQEYIASVFGKNWQDNYYVWDCCAGTGNLLVGVNRKIENVFASTIDESDVKVMYDRIENGAKLLKKNVFQFDFLNDDFKKLPRVLKDIINDPKKRKKLIIYINPPYAEATSTATRVGTKINKIGVSNTNLINLKYKNEIGKAINEIFVQFLIRIYKEITGCKLANFSTLKIINAVNFDKFRSTFQAKLEKLFLCPADTFDNVKGQFPIGFHIWDTNKKEKLDKINADTYDREGNLIGEKTIYSFNEARSLNDWALEVLDEKNKIGHLSCRGSSDFQNQNLVFISSHIITSSDRKDRKYRGTLNLCAENLIKACIYFAVRHCMSADWLNNRDQFFSPVDGWKKDLKFQNDCLAYSLFHGQNKISSEHGVNHWIPFTEKEVKTDKKFESHFMTNFIAGEIIIKNGYDLFEDQEIRSTGKLEFSPEAQSVFNAGKELWSYYLSKSRVNVNASFYDIRLYFQGESNGRMNNTSGDEEYNTLISNLREKMKILAKKIEPKVYEYGFLLR